MKKLFVIIIMSTFAGLVRADIVEFSFDPKRIVPGETVNYKAKWGILTIGSASSRVERTVYRYGRHVCYKVALSGRTNGLASLFYLRNNWTTYIDNKTFTSHLFTRSIREGNYKLDEKVYFNHRTQKATVMRLNYQTQQYYLKKVYDTPENIRDVATGFMLVRIVDFSKFNAGQRINVSGFYDATGYSVDVIIAGREYLKTSKGKVLCYKIKPIVPSNKVFDGLDAVDVWLSADKTQAIIQVKAKLKLGELILQQTDYFD